MIGTAPCCVRYAIDVGPEWTTRTTLDVVKWADSHWWAPVHGAGNTLPAVVGVVVLMALCGIILGADLRRQVHRSRARQ